MISYLEANLNKNEIKLSYEKNHGKKISQQQRRKHSFGLKVKTSSSAFRNWPKAHLQCVNEKLVFPLFEVRAMDTRKG